MKLNNLRPFAAVALAAALGVASCGRAEEKAAPAGPPPDAKRVDVSKAGSVSGRVLIEGQPPANAPIKMQADPACIKANPGGAAFETYAVEKGGLNNVFVYIKDGLGNYYFDTPSEPVKLDQNGCRYAPHVLGVRANQPLEISNSDPTLHNVHALPDKNRGFNFPQQIVGMKTQRTFATPEVMVYVKCDVHPWMNAYIGVVAHPYFAVTSDGGRFTLKDVPAGTYTVEAWHEKLGTTTQSVTIGEKETKEISFTFKAAPAASN
jgi:hypothetical protein